MIVAARQQIGCELLDQKLIVGQILVQGLHNPIAVPVGERVVAILGEYVPFGVGIPGDVEPISPPTLAVVQRFQQPIDQVRIGLGRRIGQKRVGLFRRRRQAGQVERGSANERATVGRKRRSEPCRF